VYLDSQTLNSTILGMLVLSSKERTLKNNNSVGCLAAGYLKPVSSEVLNIITEANYTGISRK